MIVKPPSEMAAKAILSEFLAGSRGNLRPTKAVSTKTAAVAAENSGDSPLLDIPFTLLLLLLLVAADLTLRSPLLLLRRLRQSVPPFGWYLLRWSSRKEEEERSEDAAGASREERKARLKKRTVKVRTEVRMPYLE